IRCTRAIRPMILDAIRAPGTGIRTQPTFPSVTGRATGSPVTAVQPMGASTVPSGRRVIVTGAAGGIGQAIVNSLAENNCRVAACDLPGTPEVNGAEITATFDVRDRVALRSAVADAITGLGGCDAIIANAGVVDTIHRAERFSETDWRKDL